jgi:hypothetical protein
MKAIVVASPARRRLIRTARKYGSLGFPPPVDRYEKVALRSLLKSGYIIKIKGATFWHSLILREYGHNTQVRRDSTSPERTP